MRVHPTMVPKQRLLASVDGVMNAVLIEGDAAGPIVCHGAGAGAEPTASSVVADLVDVVRTLTTDQNLRVPHLAFQPDRLADLPVLAMEEVETAYYLRMLAEDRPGVLAELASILGRLDISIEAVVQREPPRGVRQVHLIMLTHRVRESRMNEAIEGIEASSSVEGAGDPDPGRTLRSRVRGGAHRRDPHRGPQVGRRVLPHSERAAGAPSRRSRTSLRRSPWFARAGGVDRNAAAAPGAGDRAR